MNRALKAVLALLALAAIVLAVSQTAATAKGSTAPALTGSGSVRVSIAAPEGIPASVMLHGDAGSTYVASKPAAGTSATVAVPVVAGIYGVTANPLTVDGTFYSMRASTYRFIVYPNASAELRVSFTREDAVRDLHADSVERTAVRLTWTAQPGVTVHAVRLPGDALPQDPTTLAQMLLRGVKVRVAGSIATDSGLQPGTDYTYVLFAQHKSRWIGPLVVRVGTRSPDPAEASYVANPLTRILTAADIAGAQPTGSGVRLVLTAGRLAPSLGAAVVLPVSASLPGGFLGLVTSVSTDGRTIELKAASLDDAFDFYELNVDDFSGGDDLPAGQAPGVTSQSGREVPPAKRTPLPTGGDVSASGLPALLTNCLGGGASRDISVAPGFQHSGHFDAKLDKYKVLGVDLPKGASFDMGLAVTVSAAAKIITAGNVNCNLAPEPVTFPISSGPVPLLVQFTPTVALSITGAVEVRNVGFAATAGFTAKGHFSLDGHASFGGSVIASSTPMVPKVVHSGSIGFKVGGQLIVGPGVKTPNAGVIAGVSGDLNPIDATFSAVFPQDDPRFDKCLRVDGASTRNLALTGKAWLGGWDVSKTVTFEALQHREEFPGSPWYYPSGCKTAVDPDSVLGDGVTGIDDSVTGGGNQWGYLPGFVPGKKTWVLSTGDIADAVGAPSSFASADLGGPGDADLTTLAGRPTYDAVAYNATLVPTGDMLHVRYVFASEEYPEYVGSQFNDVMAVYVNGVNCGRVPGTTTPVSVNTINAGLNASYFVDNQAGAAGYGTSMDGLTVPLECAVPVTPGKPVTVKITVADTSDRIYDSAVALLDKGIWSD